MEPPHHTDDTATGSPPSGLTVLEAIEQLRAAGFADDMSARDGHVSCGHCGHLHAVEELDVQTILRVEGASDPADEALIAGLACSSCGARGLLVAGYGPTADPAEAAVIRQLRF